MAKILKFYPKGTPRPKVKIKPKGKVKHEIDPELVQIVKSFRSLFTDSDLDEIHRSLEE